MSVDPVTTSLLSTIMSKLGEIIITGKKVPQLVRIIHEPRKFRRTLIVRATTSSSKFPPDEEPTIEIQNPLDRKTMIKSISLVPDGTFKTNGRVIITIDDVKVLTDKAVADWTDIAEFILDFEGGREIGAGKSVKALLSSSSGAVNLTLFITFGD